MYEWQPVTKVMWCIVAVCQWSRIRRVLIDKYESQKPLDEDEQWRRWAIYPGAPTHPDSHCPPTPTYLKSSITPAATRELDRTMAPRGGRSLALAMLVPFFVVQGTLGFNFPACYCDHHKMCITLGFFILPPMHNFGLTWLSYLSANFYVCWCWLCAS